MSTSFDVVVLGGGPGGSVCATQLARRGRGVVLFERTHHPRFHLGESLLPNTLDVLETVGALEEVRDRFMIKRGARFVDGADANRTARYAFADAFRPRWDHAFQVPRDEFDELLLRRAKSSGADVREGWEAVRVISEGGRTTGVEVRDPEGQPRVIQARFVVDATGRDALVTRASGGVERIPGLDRTALFTQVRGAWRDSGERTGDIQIVVFGQGEDAGWFWMIPFADGRTSIGAVVSGAWMRKHRALAGSDASAPNERGPEALLDAAIAEAPSAAKLLEGSTRIFAPRATADFSFRVRTMWGPGWLALGDAAGFIDPLFSTGAHLAMSGAVRAAAAIDASLNEASSDADRFAAWEQEMRMGSDIFVGAVQAFYSGNLVSYLFTEPQHPFLRRAITSMLAGDVFDPDARWAREMRTRFPARFS